MPPKNVSKLAPPALPVSPSWSPIKEYGGYARGQREVVGASHSASCSHIETSAAGRAQSHLQVLGDRGLWGLGLRLLCILVRAMEEGWR